MKKNIFLILVTITFCSCSNKYLLQNDLEKCNIHLEDYLNYTIQNFEKNSGSTFDCRNKYLFGDSLTIVNTYLDTDNPYEIQIAFEDCGRYLSKGYSAHSDVRLNLSGNNLIEKGAYGLNITRHGKKNNNNLLYFLYGQKVQVENKIYNKVLMITGGDDFEKTDIRLKCIIFVE